MGSHPPYEFLAPSKIHRQPLLLPITIAHGFGAVAASELLRQGGCGLGLLAAGFGFGQRALGGGGKLGGGKIGFVHAGFLVRTLRVI